MQLSRFLLPSVLLLIATARIAFGEGAPASGAGQSPEFARDIRPILSDNCFQCHGPDPETREAGLRLDQAEEAFADLGGYQPIEPGDPDRSEIIARIEADDEFMRMPPPESGKQITPAELAMLRRWIEAGAKWSGHWAWQAPQQAAVPETRDSDWADGRLDPFILHRLESASLSPAQEADRVTLIRRLSLDLTGLPPTPEEVEAFENDRRPDAYRRLVDRLLASPAFGERLAIYWLDLVRYADTVGYHGDQDHNISPYRDYVIDALNASRPFDRFTREQLAGDLLPDRTLEQWVASGYNRLLQTTHEGGLQPKEYLAIYAADRVRNISSVWLGATLGCAQCHDHKFDPFTSRDFYSMAAFFADVDEAQHFTLGSNSLPTARPPEIDVLPRELRGVAAELDAEIGQLEQQIRELESRLAAVPPGEGASDEKPIDAQPIDGNSAAEGVAADRAEAAGGAGAAGGDSEQHRLEALRSELARAQARREELAASARRTMVTVSISPREIRILPRGNWMDDSGPVVGPAVPTFLGQVRAAGERPSRLDLADWLTDPEAGAGKFTARVLANRLWYLMMGRGLSRSLDDFGGQGSPPTHPELLDTLALELVDGDWDLKRLIRRIAMSRTYRQSSVADPETLAADPLNDWFSRQARYRVPAETVRDVALAASGLLVRRIGGDSVRPYQPEGYYRHLNFPERTYQHHRDDRQWRRGVYVHWQRQFLHPMLRAFDAPSREECTAARPQSNTPLASLVLLNDPTFVEAARALAGRLERSGGEDFETRLHTAFRLAVSRAPREAEVAALRTLWNQRREHYQGSPEAANELLGVGLAPQPAGDASAELAAWTEVARVLLNLGETITRE